MALSQAVEICLHVETKYWSWPPTPTGQIIKGDQRALCSHHSAPENPTRQAFLAPDTSARGEGGRAGKRFPSGQAFLGPYAVRGREDLPPWNPLFLMNGP